MATKMHPKIFIIGATGYIGGDFLFTLATTHPDWRITCLVRDDAKAKQLQKAFARVRTVQGDLDSYRTLENQVLDADVVFDMADSDHVQSALAITRALQAHRGQKVFWIHTSGTGTLTHENFANNTFGERLPSDKKIYNDWDGIEELTTLPDHAIHREVDKIVLQASAVAPERIKTAIVCPSCIYGLGRGSGNRSSKQVNIAAQVALSAGTGIQVGHGTNYWNEVHVRDLSNLYLSIAEDAVIGGARATWNDRGFYLVENGSFVWGDVMQKIADEGFRQGYLTSSHVKHVTVKESKSYHRWYPYICATTSRAVARRARILLDWRPEEKRMSDEIANIVRDEAAALNMKIGTRRTEALL